MSVRCAGMDVHLSYLCLLAGGQITKTINGKIHADLWNMGWNITIIRRWRKKWRRFRFVYWKQEMRDSHFSIILFF